MTSLRCPLGTHGVFLSRNALESHLVSDHSPQKVAAELIVRAYPPRPDACSKRKFPSEAAALTALISAALSRSPNRAEKRVYHCPDCGGWHLTKLDERAPS
jgi:hypothetical protein